MGAKYGLMVVGVDFQQYFAEIWIAIPHECEKHFLPLHGRVLDLYILDESVSLLTLYRNPEIFKGQGEQ